VALVRVTVLGRALLAHARFSSRSWPFICWKTTQYNRM